MISINLAAPAIVFMTLTGAAVAQPSQPPGSVPCQPGAACPPGASANSNMPMGRGPGMGQSGDMGGADKMAPGRMGPGAGMGMKPGMAPSMNPGMGHPTPNGKTQSPVTPPAV